MSDIVREQDPVTLPPSATITEACQCMRDRRVGAVLVTERAIRVYWASLRGVNDRAGRQPHSPIPPHSAEQHALV
jgi:CBS domain-containing protein